mgnify:CR=1 FL=1
MLNTGRALKFHSVGSGSLFARGSLKKLYRDDLTDDDVGAGVHDDGDLAVDFGGAFGGDLVGLVGEERLTLADGVTGLDQPGGQEAPGDGFAHGRDFDFDGHESWVGIKLEPIPRRFNGEIAL